MLKVMPEDVRSAGMECRKGVGRECQKGIAKVPEVNAGRVPKGNAGMVPEVLEDSDIHSGLTALPALPASAGINVYYFWHF